MTVRHWSIMLTLIVLLCGCNPRSTSSAIPTGVGVLVVEPTKLVATVKDDDNAVHQRITVELINRGEGPLEITGVSSSCGCTLAEKLPTEKLLPNARTTLVLNVELPSFGRKTSWVRINTNSKETPWLTIPVSLIGRSLHPPYLDHEITALRLHGTRAGDPVSQKLTLRAIERKNSAPWIQMLKPQMESIRVEQVGNPNDEPSEDDGCVKRTYEFQIEMNVPNSANGPVHGFINILTTEPSQRPLEALSVAVELRPIIKAFPEVVSFDVKPISSFPLKRRLLLVATEGGSWTYEVENGLPS